MTDTDRMTDLDSALESELLRLANRAREAAEVRDTPVVVLAGGRGTRLAPYTSVLPKPLMPIGNRSILEILVHQLADAGFRNLTFCVGYLSHLIRAVFESTDEQVAITYVKEQEPLGTAGPLRLVNGLDETFLAMNGDLLTTIDYGSLLEHHRERGNMLTIATHRRRVRSDYGVLHLDAEADDPLRVYAYEEKPEMSWNVSMGVYVFEPAALEYIPEEGCFDFPDLVQALLRTGHPIGAFMHDGLWLDIGQHDDYVRAVELWARGAALANGYPPVR